MTRVPAILSALEHIRSRVNRLSALITLGDLTDQELDRAIDEILYDLAVINTQQKGPAA